MGRGRTTALFAVAYVATAVLGRAAVLGEDSLAVVWPAAGVAVAWLLARRAPVLGPDTLVLAVATVVVTLGTGLVWPTTLVIVVAMLVQAHLAVHLVRRWLAPLWVAGGDGPFARVRDLARFALACAVGTTTGAVIFGLGFAAVSGAPAGQAALLWLTRQLCGMLALGLPLLLTLERRRLGDRSRMVRVAGTGEDVAIALATLLLYGVALPSSELPLGFLALALTAWVASRLTVLTTAWYSTVSATAIIVVTLAGRGPFGALGTTRQAALVAQAFVVVSTLVALAIVLGRNERAELLHRSLVAERRARRDAALLGEVVIGVNQAMVVVDGDRDAALNPAAGRLLGTTRASMPLDEFSAMFTWYDGTPMAPDERPSAMALSGRTVQGRDVRATRPDGTRLVLRVSTSHLVAEGDSAARAVLTFSDVTHDDLQREQLRRFARVVAHDIRNPLAAIKTLSHLLAVSSRTGTVDADRARDLSARLTASVEGLETLVGDLLEQATSRDRPLAPQPIDLRVLLEEIAVQLQADDRVVLGDQLPTVVLDPLAAAQVFTNLLANALKFVAPGTEPLVRISGCVRDGGAVVHVTDNGVGIPEGQLEAVFEEFHRAHAADYQGTGLGLAIVRASVERHGGQVTAHPGRGGGTTFELTLPVAPAVDRSAPSASRRPDRDLAAHDPSIRLPSSSQCAATFFDGCTRGGSPGILG